MRLSALLVSALFTLCTVSVKADSNDKGSTLVERGVNLLSERSTSMLKVSHQRRNKLLAKRGACPNRKSSDGSTTSTAPAVEHSEEVSDGGAKKATSSSLSQAASSSKKTKTSTPADKPDHTTDSKTKFSSTTKSSSAYTPPKTTSKQAESTSSAQSKPESTTTPTYSNYATQQLGQIWQFQGQNSGIMSWFRTNSGSDSTNGESWCQTKYKDDWPCFAPSVGTMLKDFGYDYNKAAKAYCGREVLATNPANGKQAKLFICDGFDDRWVLSPGSIDATIGAFTTLHGSFDWNKNTVVKGLKWEFTGGVVEKGTFKYGKTY